jgi:hypothetical protein
MHFLFIFEVKSFNTECVPKNISWWDRSQGISTETRDQLRDLSFYISEFLDDKGM